MLFNEAGRLFLYFVCANVGGTLTETFVSTHSVFAYNMRGEIKKSYRSRNTVFGIKIKYIFIFLNFNLCHPYNMIWSRNKKKK